jgi:hypothetical protein
MNHSLSLITTALGFIGTANSDQAAAANNRPNILHINLAVQYPDKVAALQQRLDELAKESEKPLFLVDQFKVITKGMHGEPILPTDEDFAGVEEP